jgi:hypothetical protein
MVLLDGLAQPAVDTPPEALLSSAYREVCRP